MENQKQLHIIRHGKSSWDFDEISDIDRPLSPRGVNNAYMMARRLKDNGIIPDLIISSPANRALYTAVIFARVMEIPWNKIDINENIYMGYSEDILRILEKIDNKYSSVFIFGHNPTFTVLANHFLAEQVDNIPTAGMVGLTFSLSGWNEVAKTRPDSEYFDYPKKG